MRTFLAKLDGALALIAEAKADDGLFKYGAIQGEMWRKAVQRARDKQGIDFDTENDEAVEQRKVTVPAGHTDCVFACELRIAGGDWETPVAYFRCQLIEGYAEGVGLTDVNSYFVFIPGKEQGNAHLVKADGGGWRASTQDDEGVCEKKGDCEPDQAACWEALEGHLAELAGDGGEPKEL